MDGDVINAVTSPSAGDAACLGGVGERVERAARAGWADQRGRLDAGGVAQRRGGGPVKAHVVDVGGGDEQRMVLDRAGRPVGDVPGDLFEHRHRALTPPVGDGVGDQGAAADRGSHVGRRLGEADQVGEVGN
ncbi:hypothetical protein [Nonomuraea sp. B5E05]|uniref:hypothetical protein n=1 Tax=Nonomuraea sp. B5E05 TaxID=3153569 RepID=UPI00326056C5